MLHEFLRENSVEILALTERKTRDLNQCLDVAIAGAVTTFSAKRALKQSDREVEQLGFLAHELRNALSTVTMAFSMIKDGTVTPGGSTGQVLERGIARLDDLIGRSLTEVRLRVAPRVHLGAVDLPQLVEQIALTAKPEALDRGQTLEFAVESALQLEADLQLLHSAFSNLIQNALKYTRAGGTIKVRVHRDGDQVVLEVEDQCGGLSPEAEAALFVSFEQHTENRKGLGLGLKIAKRAIELHHGTIVCQNHPGRGCTFRVRLPYLPSSAESRA